MPTIPFQQSPFFEILKPDLEGLTGAVGEFRAHTSEYLAWMERLPQMRVDDAYAPGKWTVKELLGHVIDSHIILAFRLLSFARGEVQEIPGADEGLWVRLSGHSELSLSDLARGYGQAAGMSNWVVDTLPARAMERSGTANGVLLTVREMHAYIIAHERHHRRMLKERYGL